MPVRKRADFSGLPTGGGASGAPTNTAGNVKTAYGGTSPTRTTAGRVYPTTPLPLDRASFAGFQQRRRAASRGLEEALVNRKAETGRLKLGFEQFRKRLERSSLRSRNELGDTLGARGLAFSPREMGRGLRTIRDEQTDTIAEQQATLTQQLAALDAFVNQARRDKQGELAAVGADEARRRTELDGLIRAVGV